MAEMKEFKTAAEEIVKAGDRVERVRALFDEKIEAGRLAHFTEEGKSEQEARQAVYDEATAEIDKADGAITFKLDDRVMRAYTPTPGQLTFLLAAMGRGQQKQNRFAAVMNIMMESLDEDDQEYLENRLISRKPSERLDMEQLEGIFEYLTEEWFGNPTQE